MNAYDCKFFLKVKLMKKFVVRQLTFAELYQPIGKEHLIFFLNLLLFKKSQLRCLSGA
jgi:hypothetical protein